MGGVEFKIDSVNNKGQYSIDGGANWLNFSSGVAINPTKQFLPEYLWSCILYKSTQTNYYKAGLPISFSRILLNDGTYTAEQSMTNRVWNDVTNIPSNAIAIMYRALWGNSYDLVEFYISTE